VTKAHAYGNDFLFVPIGDVADGGQRSDLPDLARRMCHRHHGVGGDGLIVYELRPGGATLQLLNADGSASELSGNGLRCLAALVARGQRLTAGTAVVVDTEAGAKRLELTRR
jgi:diaminopimelate epimerase